MKKERENEMRDNSLLKAEAARKLAERKRTDKKWFNTLKNQKRLTAYELGVFKDAAEKYFEELDKFHSGKRVSGKGKNKTVTVVPHIPEPSFKKIYKAEAKKAGLYKKLA